MTQDFGEVEECHGVTEDSSGMCQLTFVEPLTERGQSSATAEDAMRVG